MIIPKEKNKPHQTSTGTCAHLIALEIEAMKFATNFTGFICWGKRNLREELLELIRPVCKQAYLKAARHIKAWLISVLRKATSPLLLRQYADE